MLEMLLLSGEVFMFTYYTNQSIEDLNWYFLARKITCGFFESRQFKVTNLEQLAKHYMEPDNASSRGFSSSYLPFSLDTQCKSFPLD